MPSSIRLSFVSLEVALQLPRLGKPPVELLQVQLHRRTLQVGRMPSGCLHGGGALLASRLQPLSVVLTGRAHSSTSRMLPDSCTAVRCRCTLPGTAAAERSPWRSISLALSMALKPRSTLLGATTVSALSVAHEIHSALRGATAPQRSPWRLSSTALCLAPCCRPLCHHNALPGVVLPVVAIGGLYLDPAARLSVGRRT